jgi:hypothetical protein
VAFRSRWYGWQTLTADAAAASLFALIVGLDVAGKSAQGPVAGVGLGVYLLGAPAIHVAHRRVGAGLASLGIRLVAPAIGAIVGSSFNSRYSETGDQLVLGLFAGIVVASALDATLLARESVAAPAPRTEGAKPSLSPSLAYDGHAIRVSLRGVF